VFYYYNQSQNADEEQETVEMNDDDNMAREMEQLQLAERELSDNSEDGHEPIPPNNRDEDPGEDSDLSYTSRRPDGRRSGTPILDWAQPHDPDVDNPYEVDTLPGTDPSESASTIPPLPMPRPHASAAANMVIDSPTTSQPRHTAPRANRTVSAIDRAATTPAPVAPAPDVEAAPSINTQPVKRRSGRTKK
jgi:hypothetical protein